MSESEYSLLYLSRSMLAPAEQAAEVEWIVDVSQRRNRELGITGALVFTEKRFAQYLEGPEPALDALMASIGRDWRHTEIEMAFRRPIAERRFPAWTMAYAGPSTFVSGHVLSVADARGEPARIKWGERLIEMMRQFAEAQLIEQRRTGGGAA